MRRGRGIGVAAVVACLAIAWCVGRFLCAPKVAPPARIIARPWAAAAATLPPIWLEFPAYTAVVTPGDQRGQRFGISSLRLRGQEVDVCLPGMPLADWEWVRVTPDGGTERLISMFDHRQLPEDEEPWRQTEVVVGLEGTALGWEKRLPGGLRAGMRFVFRVAAPQVEATYSLANGGDSDVAIRTMIGLPGFPNHEALVEVSNAGATARPLAPFGTFGEEAAAATLGGPRGWTRTNWSDLIAQVLRQDAPGVDGLFVGEARVSSGQGVCIIRARLRAGEGETWSGAFIRSGYSTMHAYSSARLPRGHTWEASVTHALSAQESGE